jgi:hypothetical protein
MVNPRYNHTATLLPNGKVLVTGGLNGSTALNSAELYDPAIGSWSSTDPMTDARTGHTATLLSNGKVLVASGDDDTVGLTSAELYDPASGHWSGTGSINTARRGHLATLLPNGKVLVEGGCTGGPHTCSVANSAELYDPNAYDTATGTMGTWTTTGSMSAMRVQHTATLLPNGKVMVAGGIQGIPLGAILSSAELYDPATGTWSTTSSMTAARYALTATLLFNDTVLVAGGGVNSSAELFYPAGILNPIVQNYSLEVPWPVDGSTFNIGSAAFAGIPIIGRISGQMGFDASANGAFVATANLAIPTVNIALCSPSAPEELTATYNIVGGGGSYQGSVRVLDNAARTGIIPNPCGSDPPQLELWQSGLGGLFYPPAWWPSGLIDLMPTPMTAPNGDGTAYLLLTGPVSPPGQAVLPNASPLTFGRIQLFPPGTYTITLTLKIGDYRIETAGSIFTVAP